MVKNKTEISYWLKLEDGEESILSTETSKVPEKGEVISFDHHWDEERANHIYEHLSEEHKKTFFPAPEKLLSGDYLVVSVKRYIKVDYIKTKISEVFKGVTGFIGQPNSTSLFPINEPVIPVSYNRECFEVMLEPVKEVGVETPISRVRNLLGPIVTYFEILKVQGERHFDEDIQKGLNKISDENLAVCYNIMEELTKVVKDDKNW